MFHPKETHRATMAGIRKKDPLNSVLKAGHWYKGDILNEKLHLFDKPNSQYRKAIKNIAQSLMDGKNLV